MEEPAWVKKSFPTFIRLLRRGVPVVLVILIALVVVHTVLNVVLHRRFAAKLAEIKRAGGAITLSELVPDPVPHEQNADVYYSYAFSVMERALAEDERRSERIVEAFEILWPHAMSSQEWLQEVKREPEAPRTDDGFQALMVRMMVRGTNGKKLADLSWTERQQRERAIQAAREYLRRVQPGVDADGREIELAARHLFKSASMARGLQVVKDAREFDRTLLLTDYELGPDVVVGSILPRTARFRVLSLHGTRILTKPST